MTFGPLNTYANGDTNYVTKLNQDMGAIGLAINALQGAAGGAAGTGATTAQTAAFGPQTAFIGSNSYRQSTATTILTLSMGYAWRPDLGSVLYKGSSTGINFATQAAATYYIIVGPDSVPVLATASAPGALYSVVWTGTAFGTITRVAPIVWNYYDWTLAQTSTALGLTFDSLSARLEHDEAGLANALVTYASPTGASNDVNPGGAFPTGVGRVDVTLAAGPANWTGFLAGVDGQRVTLSNQDTVDSLTLNVANAGSLPANRFGGATDFTLPPGSSTDLRYYAGSINLWRIIK